jgi:hypothetical protein
MAQKGSKAETIIRSQKNIARDELKKDWDMERPQMVADLLAQCSTLQMEARKAGHYHIALGAINTAAKLAQIVS